MMMKWTQKGEFMWHSFGLSFRQACCKQWGIRISWSKIIAFLNPLVQLALATVNADVFATEVWETAKLSQVLITAACSTWILSFPLFYFLFTVAFYLCSSEFLLKFSVHSFVLSKLVTLKKKKKQKQHIVLVICWWEKHFCGFE